MGLVVERTNCSRVLTYPGSPPRYLYDAVLERPDADLSQVVREQHLLHMAQARYYRRLEAEEEPILVLGDGEFEMDLSLVTEAQYAVESATIFVIDNQRLGLVTERQQREFGTILTPKTTPIDYDAFATGLENVESTAVSAPAAVKPAARRALESDRISVVAIRIAAELTPDVFDPFELPGLSR